MARSVQGGSALPVYFTGSETPLSVSVSGGTTSDTELQNRVGATNEGAAASDTAISGLNGLLKRIAQRLTSLIALFPATPGQKTKANSFAVTLASDSDALPINDNGGSVTVDGTVSLTSGTTVLPGAAATASGVTPAHNNNVVAAPQTIKGSAGRLYHVHVFNPNAAISYLQIFNHAAPTVGSTPASHALGIPANGHAQLELSFPIVMGTAITVAATTTPGGSVAPATGLVVNVGYV